MELDLIEKGFYSHPCGGTGRNVITFGADMSSSVHVDNKGKDVLILGKGPTQGLGEHSLSAEKMYSINFTKINTKFCLSLHYNGVNSYLFVNGTEIQKFTVKDSEIVHINGYIYDLSADFDAIDVDNILDIQKHLIKK